ncbi:hypothetical protein O181_027915 [Austropuccinia psidii MF-1]|uniref:Uncharacterized protein n=1 Tax=Austropuccinia psidii MF-1 TaxID=1389203 RepID=A0A9Q3H3N6_9BASI|nr:hypothetical protein [Austropuccinia psidii MF-1]
MASSRNVDPSQIYDGYKAVEVLDPACTECLKKGWKFFQHENPHFSKCHHCFSGKKPCQHPGAPLSNVKHYLWSKKDGPFGKEFPVSEAPTPDGTSGCSNLTGSRKRDVDRWTNVGGPIPVGGRPIYSSSEVPISRIKNEGSDELVGGEVEVVLNSVGNQSSTSPSQHAAKIFQIQVIPSTPRNSQLVLCTISSSIPPPSPNTSTSRPAIVLPLRPSPISQPRNSLIVTSQKLHVVASCSRRREGLLPLPFPATQVFQQRECWPIQVTREDPNMANEGQDSVARLFRRFDRNSGEVIAYANDRMIPGTASEEMTYKFSW